MNTRDYPILQLDTNSSDGTVLLINVLHVTYKLRAMSNDTQYKHSMLTRESRTNEYSKQEGHRILLDTLMCSPDVRIFIMLIF
jgi:hypothetical protein